MLISFSLKLKSLNKMISFNYMNDLSNYMNDFHFVLNHLPILNHYNVNYMNDFNFVNHFH